MQRCEHTAWLQVSSDACKTNIVWQPDRIFNLLSSVIATELVTPSLWILIGNVCKSNVLRDLVASRSSKRVGGRRRAGEIHLQIERDTATSEHPHLIADGDISKPSCTKVASNKHHKCHQTSSFPVTQREVADQVADRLYSCVLQPFSDVFCLFSNDIGGLRASSRLVAGWLSRSKASLVPVNTFPQLIIVIDGFSNIDERQTKDRFLKLLAQDTSISIHDCFSEVDVVSLPVKNQMPGSFSSRRLRERLRRASDKVRRARKDARLLFKAKHFNGFFKLACKHVSEYADVPFDVLSATRVYNPVAPDMVIHLSNFIKRIRTPRELFEYAIPMVASSFFLDSYPPDAPSRCLEDTT